MGNFVTGTIVQNKAGATYEGTVYDRRLVLQPPKGQEIFIFDPAEPISTDLSINEMYDLVLVPFTISVQIVSASPMADAPVDFDGWQGTVIDVHWKATKEEYRLIRPELYEGEWILLHTAFGNILLNPRSIKEMLSEGMIVQWARARVDLYAIV
ncbi:MAG: hypothetical protein ABI234_14755 [Ktedonobacteraceae bacterium]